MAVSAEAGGTGREEWQEFKSDALSKTLFD
jgi:hypothetical protein